MLLHRKSTWVRIDAPILRKRKIHAAKVPLAREKVERGRQNGDQKQVQDAEVDKTSRNANDIAAVGDGESDDVVEPEKVDPAAECGMVAASGAEVVAVGKGAAALDESGEGEEEPGEGAESEETPFVVGIRVGREEVGEDPGGRVS